MGGTVAALIFFYPLLRSAWRRWGHRVPRAVVEGLGPVVLVALAAWIYLPLVKGHSPTTWDNNYGLLKIVEAEDLLKRHQVFGWSDYENAGFPAHTNYPMAGAMVAVGLHALPGVSLERAHAWSLWLAMLSISFACYLAARLHFGRTVALIAGFLALFDPGDWWAGGHTSTVDVGMWIQTVCTAWVVLGLALWPIAVQTGRRVHIVLAGVALGVGVLFHPMAMMLAGAAGPVMLLALLATPRPGPLPTLLRTAGVVAVCLSVCAFWLVPYGAKSNFSWFPSVEAQSSTWLWEQVIKGTLLRGPGLWLGAALAGGIVLAGRKGPYGRFLVIAVVVFCVLFTVEALNLLHLRDAKTGGAVDQLQLPRMHFLVRPMGFILAAYALGATLPLALRRFSGSRGGWPNWLNRALVAVLVWVFIQVPGAKVPGLPDDPVPRGMKGDDWDQTGPALDYAKSQMQPGERLILHLEGATNHDLVFPAAQRQVRLMKIGTDAALMFKNRFSTDDPELLERIGGSVMVSQGNLPRALKSLPVAKTFGSFEVRTLPRLPRAWMDGPGHVEVASWKDEEVRLKVTGSGPKSKVRLGLAYYDTWRTDDGVKTAPFTMHEATLSEVPAHDGDMVVRYHYPGSQWLGLFLSLGGLATLVASRYVTWPRRRRSAPVSPVVEAAQASSGADGGAG
jgi:hypothetical protein